MSEAFEYMNNIRRMLDTLMQDGIMYAQTCEPAKTWIDAAFDALDEAVAAQGKFEESP